MSPTQQAIPPSTVPATPSTDPAIAAFGTLIQVLSAATPETYATIAGVGDITGPNTNVAEVETTSHSTGQPHKTFMPTLIVVFRYKRKVRYRRKTGHRQPLTRLLVKEIAR